MTKFWWVLGLLLWGKAGFGWGFYAHKMINYHAVFMLPPEMMMFYKKHIEFLREHAVDPDKRRYAIVQEGPRHYIDIDQYGDPKEIPRVWKSAVEKFSEDSLMQHGIVPWWIQVMLQRLTTAFRNKDGPSILKVSAELGHYIGDAHVPLHASSNHNGQLTNQHGIHGFWESRIPELLAETNWDFLIGKAVFIKDPLTFTWQRVLESAAAADSVLRIEKSLDSSFPSDKKYAFEGRNGIVMKQYSAAYAMAYDKLLNNMVERRFRQSIYSVASFWYTAWVNAGQPGLGNIAGENFNEADLHDFEDLNKKWSAEAVKGKSCN